MKPKSKLSEHQAEMDMTPMIDVTFQLITFFMMTINFAEAEQTKRVELPHSTIAQPPPEISQEAFLTLHVDDVGNVVVFRGKEYTLENLGAALKAAIQEEIHRKDRARKHKVTTAKDITVILRGDRNAPTGFVQKVIELCQKTEFTKFKLRADKTEFSSFNSG
jgi:biopolymer transport protein ExbD